MDKKVIFPPQWSPLLLRFADNAHFSKGKIRDSGSILVCFCCECARCDWGYSGGRGWGVVVGLQRVVYTNATGDPGEWAVELDLALAFAFDFLQLPTTYSQDLFSILIKYMCGKAPVCTEHLSLEHAPHSQIFLRHKSNVLSLRIHDDIFVSLLEAHHHIHQFQLPCDDYSRICQYTGGGMILSKNAIRILWNMHGGQKIIL